MGSTGQSQPFHSCRFLAIRQDPFQERVFAEAKVVKRTHGITTVSYEFIVLRLGFRSPVGSHALTTEKPDRLEWPFGLFGIVDVAVTVLDFAIPHFNNALLSIRFRCQHPILR